MKVLSVAEKPSVAKEIAKILAGGEQNYQKRPGQSQYNYVYEISSCPFKNQQVNMMITSVNGHLMEIEFDGDYKSWTGCRPIDLFDAPIKRSVKKENEKIELTLLEQSRRCQVLLLWLDCDVEGENIAFEVIEVCKRGNPRLEIYRARFSALIERDIFRTVNNPDRPNQHFSDSVDARQEIDLRLGAAFTRFQTLRLQSKYEKLRDTLISYGPCQFPTLGFVVDRHLKIEAFKPETYWTIQLSYECDDHDEISGKLQCNFSWSRGHVYDRYVCTVLYDMCLENGGFATIKSVEARPTTKHRPIPMNTIALQKLSSTLLHMSSDKTMATAEALYQRGILSYPRTETDFYKEGFDIHSLIEEQIPHSIWGEYARSLLHSNKFCHPKNGGHDDQAHPPIHPTKRVELNELSEDERKIYELVTRHFLASCSYDGKGNLTTVMAKIPDTEYGETFTATGLMVLERNYLDIYTYEKWYGHKVPKFNVNDQFQPKSLLMTSGVTCPPPPISESDLIAEMDRNGIGTDATIAEHIKTIQKREYVIKDNQNRFIPTKLGLALVEAYNSMGYQLTKPFLRATMEADCHKIARGELKKEDVIKACLQRMRECFITVNREVNKLDTAVSKYFDVAGSGHDDRQYQTIERNLSTCGICRDSMDLKVSMPRGGVPHNNGPGDFTRRLLYCGNCDQSHLLPNRGELRAQDILCLICGFQVLLVINRENQKEHSLCPYCFKNPPGPPDSEEGIAEFRCFSCSKSSCPLSGRVEGNDVDIAPCAEPNCQGKMKINRGNKGYLLSCNRQGCKGVWWLPKRGILSGTIRRPIVQLPDPCPRGAYRIDPSIVRGFPPEVIVCPGCDRLWEELHHPRLPLPSPNTLSIGNVLQQQTFQPQQLQMTSTMSNISDYGAALAGVAPVRHTNHSVSDKISFKTKSTNDTNDGPECRCGTQAKLLTVQKEGQNKGRQFYACPKPQGQQCGYFCWSDEVGLSSRIENMSVTPIVRRTNTMTSQSSSTRTGVDEPICFRCQRSGHFARQCPNVNK